MIKLTPAEEEYKHYSEKYCFICEKPFSEEAKNNYIKVRDHCHYNGKYRGAAHKNEIPVVFHNVSIYDYHFIIKGLAEEFDRYFECLGENKEKYITFSIPIKIESNNDQTIIYRIKFIDSFRFMPTFLSALVDNLSNRIHDKRECDSCGYHL